MLTLSWKIIQNQTQVINKYKVEIITSLFVLVIMYFLEEGRIVETSALYLSFKMGHVGEDGDSADKGA